MCATRPARFARSRGAPSVALHVEQRRRLLVALQRRGAARVGELLEVIAAGERRRIATAGGHDLAAARCRLRAGRPWGPRTADWSGGNGARARRGGAGSPKHRASDASASDPQHNHRGATDGDKQAGLGRTRWLTSRPATVHRRWWRRKTARRWWREATRWKLSHRAHADPTVPLASSAGSPKLGEVRPIFPRGYRPWQAR